MTDNLRVLIRHMEDDRLKGNASVIQVYCRTLKRRTTVLSLINGSRLQTCTSEQHSSHAPSLHELARQFNVIPVIVTTGVASSRNELRQLLHWYVFFFEARGGSEYCTIQLK